MESGEAKETEDLGGGVLESAEKQNFDGEIKEGSGDFDCLIQNPIESEQLPEKDANLSIEGVVYDDNGVVEHPREQISEPERKNDANETLTATIPEGTAVVGSADVLEENAGGLEEVKDGNNEIEGGQSEEDCFMEACLKEDVVREENMVHAEVSNQCFLLDPNLGDGYESGTEEEQAAFMSELTNFFRERGMEFKPPKFYGIGLNCLKLWRAVIKLGGYDTVTSCKLWRQVGESFKPPKTCTTISWSFRCFYEKALLDYERHKVNRGELTIPVTSHAGPMGVENQVGSNQASGSGRARRDAAARAMQGWHSERLLGNGEDKNSVASPKSEKHLKNFGVLKRKKPSSLERALKAARTKGDHQQVDVEIADVGPRADWVKVNIRKTKDCFEVYALVPGLLREEVRVQTDPAGRLVILGKPEQPDNPWGVTPFKKVITLPSRIDPHQTSAVVTLHGQLFVRVPFEQSDL